MGLWKTGVLTVTACFLKFVNDAGKREIAKRKLRQHGLKTAMEMRHGFIYLSYLLPWPQ
jgi:hypothetical protein